MIDQVQLNYNLERIIPIICFFVYLQLGEWLIILL